MFVKVLTKMELQTCVLGGGHYINIWVTIINNSPAGALKQ